MDATAHGISVDWIMPGDRKDSNAVRHDNVLALPDDLKTSLLQGAHCIQVIDPRDLAHDTRLRPLFPEFDRQERCL